MRPFRPLCTAALLSATLLCAAVMPAHAQSQQLLGTELGRAYQAIKEKNFDDAEKRLLALQQKSPDDAYVLLNLGVVYQMTGRKEQAVALYERIIGEQRDASKSAATSAGDNATDRMVGRSPADIARYNLRLLGN